MLAEAPPHEQPLRRDRDALFGFGNRGRIGVERERFFNPHAGQPSRRMRGSSHMSSRSESSVPITVSTPSIRMIVPARNMSRAIKALNNSGPTVGRLKTIDTITLPETMYGSV